MKHRHWYYFLSIEKELIEIADYIEIHSDNFKTFSVSLTKSYLSICSEIDVILKLLAERSDSIFWNEICTSFPKKKYPDMQIYRAFFTAKFPAFQSAQIDIPLYNLYFKPWENFIRNRNPDWWDKYNKVKHSRNEHYKSANLKNVLHSASGLLVSLLFYYGLDKDLYLDGTSSTKLFSVPNEFLSDSWKLAPAQVVIP